MKSHIDGENETAIGAVEKVGKTEAKCGAFATWRPSTLCTLLCKTIGALINVQISDLYGQRIKSFPRDRPAWSAVLLTAAD